LFFSLRYTVKGVLYTLTFSETLNGFIWYGNKINIMVNRRQQKNQQKYKTLRKPNKKENLYVYDNEEEEEDEEKTIKKNYMHT
jgi:hypothetical protein